MVHACCLKPWKFVVICYNSPKEINTALFLDLYFFSPFILAWEIMSLLMNYLFSPVECQLQSGRVLSFHLVLSSQLELPDWANKIQRIQLSWILDQRQALFLYKVITNFAILYTSEAQIIWVSSIWSGNSYPQCLKACLGTYKGLSKRLSNEWST